MSYSTPKGFLKGIRFSTFLDTCEEWHAFVNGFCEVLCPWPPRVRMPSPLMGEGQGEGDLTREYHYYQFGRAIGVIAWLVIAEIIKEVFF
jgi:hypothetical protein